MNQDDRVSNKEAFANISMKRKRGRPRKHPRQNLDHGNNVIPRFQNLNLRESTSAGAPPGFHGVNRNRPGPINANNNSNDVLVGQVVHGVIEAAFDAGYLLNVKVGNSGTTLRGVVLKPGHYVPVSAENDVAPNLQMVRRNEIPSPTENHSQVLVPNSQSRKRCKWQVNPYRNGTGSLGVSKGREGASISFQAAHPVFSKNIYQPVNLPNGRAVTKQPSSVPRQAIHTVASKVKPVVEAVTPSNGSKPASPVIKVENVVFPLHNHIISHQGMPFEKLLTEVIRRVQPPSQSEETQNGNKDNGANNMDQALSIEPLQAVQPYVNGHSASLPKPFETFKTGKMTELLRAVQQNMMENHAPQFVEQATSRSLTSDSLSPVAEVGDQKNDGRQCPSV